MNRMPTALLHPAIDATMPHRQLGLTQSRKGRKDQVHSASWRLRVRQRFA